MPDKDLYIPIALLVFVVHIVLAGLTFIDRENLHKYHDYSGIQGLLIVMMRVGLFVLFQVWVAGTRGEASRKAREYLRDFNWAGSTYLLSFPALWVAAYTIPTYWQLMFIVSGCFVF